MSWHQVQHSPSTIIHPAQHTPNTASTAACLSSHHSHDDKVTPECSFSSRCASLHDRLPSASSPWALKGTVTLAHSHRWKLTYWRIEAQHPARRPSTASEYESKLARLRPSSSHNRCLQVSIQTRSTTASECIFKLAWLRPPTSLDQGLQVYLQTRSVTILECISKFTQSRHPSVSPNTLEDRLEVHLQSPLITASECCSEFCRSSFSGALWIALKHRLQSVRIYHV